MKNTLPEDSAVRLGFLTYDLQPFTEDCLYRVAQAIAPLTLTAYPVVRHPHQEKARISCLSSEETGKHLGVQVKGSTPEGFMSNVNWRAAWRCCRDSQIVVLFGLQGGTALLTAFLASVMGRTVISVNQTLPVQWELRRRWWVQLLKRWLLRRCDRHIYQTPVSREVLTKVYGVPEEALFHAPFEAGCGYFEGVLAQYRGVREERRRALGVAEDQALFLFVGNLHRFKGVADIIEALALLPPKARHTVAFAGPEALSKDGSGTIAYYEELARRRGVADRVRFLGCLGHRELAETYWAADAVLLPTHKDCFPKVLVEAALTGKPLVTSHACGAVGAMVIDGENGFVVEPGDIAALARALYSLLDPALRERMGRRSLELVRAFCDGAAEVEGFRAAIMSVAATSCDLGRAGTVGCTARTTAFK